MGYDAFISYSSHDEAAARSLFNRLRRFSCDGERLTIAFAPVSINPGASIPGNLLALLDDSLVTAAVVSPAWVESKWCRFEVETAVWPDPSGDDERLVLCQFAEARLPTALARLKRLRFDLNFNEALSELVAHIRRCKRRGQARLRKEAFLTEQREAILHSGLLPWVIGIGPALEFIWPEMVIDPKVVRYRRPGELITLGEFRDVVRGDVGIVIVAGEPGAGKSTALKAHALSLHDAAIEPIIMHARAVATVGDTPGGGVWLIDGLDEVGPAGIAGVLDFANQRCADGSPVWICGRSDFLFQYLPSVSDRLHRIMEIVEIQPWGVAEIRSFAKSYLKQAAQPDLWRLVEGLLASPAQADFLSNPMRLTLALYLLTAGLTQNPRVMTHPYHLYDTFYREWLRREVHRGTQVDSGEIQRLHVEIAKWIYAHPGRSLLARVGELPSFEGNSGFWGLLDARQLENGAIDVRGFRHLTLAEYLLADRIVRAFKTSVEAVSSVLDLTVGDDVNTFVRSAFDAMGPADRAEIREHLETAYRIYWDQGESERWRELLLYYLGRIPSVRPSELLVDAWRNEESPIVRRAAALGAILQGSSEVEREFLETLDIPAHDLLNRSVQLAYFGDVFEDLHEFVDDGGDWTRTRNSLLRRLESSSLRAVRLRRWDLATLRSFAISRGELVLAQSEFDELTELLARLRAEADDRAVASLSDALGVARVSAVDEVADLAPWMKW